MADDVQEGRAFDGGLEGRGGEQVAEPEFDHFEVAEVGQDAEELAG